MTIPELVGSKLRRLREKRGWSLKKAAGYAEMDYSNYSKIERGKHDPRISTIIHILESLEYTFEDFYKAKINGNNRSRSGTKRRNGMDTKR